MASKTSLLRPGNVVGGFEVEDLIGIGGMATVYRAEQISLDRPVALKVLARQFTGDEVFRERFRREGMHAASLEHPNIVPVYDSGEHEGLLYLAMRLVDGSSLAELLSSKGVSADQAIEILRPVASALDCAHAAGLIHRDVKPQNILITNQGHPYLADFGVAKSANASGLTATGGFVGSVNYASPEQIKGLTLTPASDIYALTAVLYHCLSGNVPYPNASEAGVMHAHLHDPPPTLPSLRGADSEFHSVFARGMAKDPGARYGHAGDLLNAASISVSRMPSDRRKSVPAFPETKEEGQTESPVAPPQAQSLTAVDQRREPAPPEAPPEPLRRRWPRPQLPSRRTLAAVGIVAAVALVVVLAVTSLGGDGGPSAKSVHRGSVELSYEAPWRAVAAKRNQAPLGLELEAPIMLENARTTLVAGMLGSGAAVPGDIPPAVAKQLDSKPRETTLHLGGVPAVRYAATAEDGARDVTLFVVPTDVADIALLCEAPQGGGASGSCTKTAATLHVVGAQPVLPGADPALAGRLGKVLRPAAAARGEDAKYVTSRATDVRATRRIAEIDAGTAKRLAGLPAEPRDRHAVDALAGALRQEARALGAAAAAANTRRYSDYADAEASIRSAGKAVAKATGNLRRMAFVSVPELHPLDVPPLHRPAPEPEPSTNAGESPAPSAETESTEAAPEYEPAPAPAPAPAPEPAPAPAPEHPTVPAQPLG